jgi:hypothetical protein
MAFGIYFAPRSVRAIFAYPLRMILEFVTTYAITMKGSVAAASHQDSRIAHPAAVTNRVRRLRRKGASEADDMMKKHRRDIERDYPLPALSEKLRVSQMLWRVVSSFRFRSEAKGYRCQHAPRTISNMSEERPRKRSNSRSSGLFRVKMPNTAVAGGFGPAEYVLLHHRQAGDRPHWRRWVFREVGPALND